MSLSDEDRNQLLSLLRRFCEEDLDQWQLWRTTTSFGPAYISITRKLSDGTSSEAYDDLA